MAQFQLPLLQIVPLYFSISEKGMLLSLTTHSSVLSPFHPSAAPSPTCLFNSPCPVALLLVVTVKSVLVRSKATFPFLKATILLFATSRAPLPTYGTRAALGPPIAVDLSSSTHSSTSLDHKPQVHPCFLHFLHTRCKSHAWPSLSALLDTWSPFSSSSPAWSSAVVATLTP